MLLQSMTRIQFPPDLVSLCVLFLLFYVYFFITRSFFFRTEVATHPYKKEKESS